MIKASATLSIQCISLECIQVKEYQPRYLDRLCHYVQVLKEHPDDYPGMISVEPSQTHPGMYALLDGYHRFCAAILTGRECMLCLVVDDERERRATYGR